MNKGRCDEIALDATDGCATGRQLGAVILDLKSDLFYCFGILRS